jgi:competence protein ComEA
MRRLRCVIGILIATVVASAPVARAQTAKTQAPKAAAAKATTAGPAKAASAARVRATPGAPVNLNAATIAQLQTLPGVGASTAQRILDYREKNGGFKKIEELMNVKGVGEKSFLKLKPLIIVGADKGAGPDGRK